MNEPAHVTLIRHGFVRELCACGGVVVAETRMPDDVYVAVRRHNKTSRHKAWRRSREEV